jgi:threonine dehydrogenase-like Zn-dependent dehydrogenase
MTGMRDDDGRCVLTGSRSGKRQTWLTLGVGALVGAAAFACRTRGDRFPQRGRVSVPGVYGGFLDKVTLGAPMEKGLQVSTGQTHVQRCANKLLRRIRDGEIDTTVLNSHRLPLEETATGYDDFKNKQNESTNVVLKPGAAVA